MQFTVYHTFESLSAADGGKQHKFSWYAQEGRAQRFVCHAMYQSGVDIVKAGAVQARRGDVFRLQFDENGPTAPGNGIELAVNGEGWEARDYVSAVKNVLYAAFGRERAAAAACQLASLYNLMATQYGGFFLKSIVAEAPSLDRALDAMVTDQQLLEVSQWVKGIGAGLLKDGMPALPPLICHTPPRMDYIPAWSWVHEIETQAGAKCHKFAFWKRKDALPEPLSDDFREPNYPYRKVLEAGYMSGDLGEKVVVFPFGQDDIGIGLHARFGAEALELEDHAGAIPSPIDPVPVAYNAQTIRAALEDGTLDGDQAASAFVMLASVYRLVGTRYNGPFGYGPDGQRLQPHYFDGPASDVDATKVKQHAFSRAVHRDDTIDVMFRDGRMYLRPQVVKDAATLNDFIRDRRFGREAALALDAAASLMRGETAPSPGNGPAWTLGAWISGTSRLAHK